MPPPTAMKFAVIVCVLLSLSQIGLGYKYDLEKLKEELLKNAAIASEQHKIHPIKEGNEDKLHDDKQRAECSTAVGACGGSYSGTGCIASPDYGQHNYDNDIECIYQIEVPEGKRVELTIEDVDIEEHKSCMWDRLEIVPGQGIFGALRVCGTGLPKGSFVSMASTMTVRLISDATENGRGFAAKFDTITIEAD